MAPPSLLILDLDGTLVDSFADIDHGIRCALAAIGCEPTQPLMALCRRGVPLETFFRRATGRDPDAADSRADLATFVDTYRANYAVSGQPTPVYPGVAETLTAIRALPDRPRVAVATSKRTDMARDVVHRAGLTDLIDFVRGSDGVRKKPDPELLQVVANAVGRPVEDAVMVGDTDKDVGAARAAGCRVAAAVTYGGWPRHELETLDTDLLVDSFSELLPVFSR